MKNLFFLSLVLIVSLTNCANVDCKAVFMDKLSAKVDSATIDNDLSIREIDEIVKKTNPSLGYDGEQITYPDTFNFCQ